MKITIKFKLLALLTCLTTAMAAITVAGWLSLAKNEGSLRTVYEDRVVPLKQLKTVSDLYAVNVVDTAHKVRNGGMEWDRGQGAVEQASAQIVAEWKAYSGTYLTSDEAALVAEAQTLMSRADRGVAALLGLLRSKDQSGLDAFVTQDLYASIDPVTEKIAALVDLQLAVAASEFEGSRSVVATSRHIMGSLAALCLAMVAFAAWITVAGVSRPLSAMTQAMSSLAGGSHETEVPGQGQRNEIGTMAAALQVFKESAIRMREVQADAERKGADAAARTERLQGATSRFETTIKEVVGSLTASAGKMRSTAESMSTTAEETSRQSTAVAAASEQASTNVQTVATAAEELSASIAEISRQVTQSTTMTGAALDQAGRTSATVKSLAESAGKIGEIVDLINEIAGKTNLLALNATIEAARAGEAGKGFAVVASEVKALATQTGKATQDIAQQIGAIQAQTGEAVKAIETISSTIGEINSIATTIASAVEEQGAATQEIARNVQQAAAGTGEVSTNISGVSQAAGDTGRGASETLRVAGDLTAKGDTLRLEVDNFLAEVRAA